tara:strand:- start:760 stop:1431 length:672 start_codon:yes stop_codon:yes gene_type:complete
MKFKNNSKEMKTQVQTFVIEETAELIYDNDKLDRWNDLVSSLNLKGQTKIVTPDKSPIPFMHLKSSMINVFKTLCPRSVDVSEYDITPIPVEILDLIALSVGEKYFGQIEIWYDEKSPDPVCVGMTGYYYESQWNSTSNKLLDGMEFKTRKEVEDMGGKHVYFRDKNYYLLGKWGDVKYSFDKLKEMATKRFVAECSNDLNKKIKEAQRELLDVETKAFDKFN